MSQSIWLDIWHLETLKLGFQLLNPGIVRNFQIYTQCLALIIDVDHHELAACTQKHAHTYTHTVISIDLRHVHVLVLLPDRFPPISLDLASSSTPARFLSPRSSASRLFLSPFQNFSWIPFPRIAPSSTSTGKRSSTTSISKRTSLLCFLATSYSNRYDTQHTGRHKIKTRAEAREDDFAHTIGTQAGFCQQTFSLPHTFC